MRTLASLMIALSLVFAASAQEGAAINWESYKDVEFDFGDSLMRVNSEYEAYAFATGGPSVWSSTPSEKEPTPITGPFTTELQSIVSSQSRATASALTSWFLHADEHAGTARLANAAAGTTAIDDKYDPTVVAMSWAAQSTSVELGEEVSQGSIDWSPGISVGTGGGAFLSSYDVISIHDPIVVWTKERGSNTRTPTTVFELFAEFDAETELHWNQIRRIQTGIDGAPELVLVPNDGPFLDAGLNGSGSFTLRMENDLLPLNRRGTIRVAFENGIVTSSQATGVFSDIAPNDIAPIGSNRLPTVGSVAKIDSIVLTSQLQPQPIPGGGDAIIDRFALNLAVDEEQVITDVAACSDGIHVSVGPAIDTIQTFALNPMQRQAVTATTAIDDLPGQTLGACLGEIRPDADLLFGTDYVAGDFASLHREADTNEIDRFLRLSPTPDVPTQVAIFEQGENRGAEETRRWSATFDVRRSVMRAIPSPVEPINPSEVPIVDVDPGDILSNDNILDGGTIGAAQTLADQTVTFAVGLLDVATYGVTFDQSDEARAAPEEIVRLFDSAGSGDQRVDGVVLTVTESSKSTVAKLLVGGRQAFETDITKAIAELDTEDDPWQHFEFDLREQAGGLRLQINLVDGEGELITRVGQRLLPSSRLSDKGYRLAVGSKSESDRAFRAGHDFDNLILTFQDNADLAWDGKIDVADFRRMRIALEGEVQDPFFDLDLDGLVNTADLAVIEKMISNKIPGDTDLSGRVTFSDFLVLSEFYGKETNLWSEGDFDGDGFVRFPDFLALSRNYESATDAEVQVRLASLASESVPEPSAATSVLLGLLLTFMTLRSPLTSRRITSNGRAKNA